VPPSNVSAPVSFGVTGQRAFEDTVKVSCGNLHSGASCNFLSSGSVNPTSTTSVAITLTVDTTATAAAGTFPITINGSVTNGPTKTRSLSLTITLDYSVVISNPALQAYVNSAVNFKRRADFTEWLQPRGELELWRGWASCLLWRAGACSTDCERCPIHCDGGKFRVRELQLQHRGRRH
jgi:hypothetical protein